MFSRLFCVLFFVAWTAELDGDPMLYFQGWRSPFKILSPIMKALPGVNVSPWLLLLLLITPICLIQPRALKRSASPMLFAVVGAAGTLFLWLAWGWVRGGNWWLAYYQIKALSISLLVSFVLPTVIRTPRDLKRLGLTVVAAALVRGSLAIYFFHFHIKDKVRWPYPEFMTNHEDSALFVAGILIALAWALARSRGLAWALVLAIVPYLMYAIKVNTRRLAWIELAFALAGVYLLLGKSKLGRRIRLVALCLAPFLVVYAAVGWGRSEGIFAPLHAIHSTTGESEDDSSKTRNEENLNLAFTYQTHPLVGTGWGHPYYKIFTRWTSYTAFWTYDYLPHNSLVGLWSFMGLLGFVGVWSIFPVAAFLASRSYRMTGHPVGRAGAMAAFCFLPVYSIQAYGDMGVQSLTGGLLLSIALATAARVAVWTGAWTTRGVRRASPSSGTPSSTAGAPLGGPT